MDEIVLGEDVTGVDDQETGSSQMLASPLSLRVEDRQFWCEHLVNKEAGDCVRISNIYAFGGANEASNTPSPSVGVTVSVAGDGCTAGHSNAQSSNSQDSQSQGRAAGQAVDNVIPFRAVRDFKAELMQFNLLDSEDFNVQFDAWFEALTAPPTVQDAVPHLRLVHTAKAEQAEKSEID